MMGDYQAGSSTELRVRSIFREFHYIGLIDEIHWEGNHFPAPLLLGGLASSESQPPSSPVVGLSGDHLRLSRDPCRVTSLA